MSIDFQYHFDNLDNLQKHFDEGDLYKYRVTPKGLIATGPLSRRTFKILPGAKTKANFNIFARESLKELKAILREINPGDSLAIKRLKERIETIFKHLNKGELSKELEKEKKEVESLAEQFDRQVADDSFHSIVAALKSEKVDAVPSTKPPFTFAPLTDVLYSRLFFHIHGDALGEETGLEGQPTLRAAEYLMNFLRANPRYGSEKILKTLQSAIDLSTIATSLQRDLPKAVKSYDQKIVIENYAKTLGKAIRDRLEKSEPVGLFSGWAGDPLSHAIFMEITKEGEDNYSVRFYNTGAGIDSLEAVTVDYKMKHRCFEEYKGVKQADLFNPNLLKGLLELTTFSKDPTIDKGIAVATATNYGPEDFYNGIVKLLNVKKSSPHYELEDLMSAQRIGTCTWKSLCAFMRRNLSRSEYKRFKLEIKLQSLKQFYESEKYRLYQSRKDLALIKRATEKFAREVLKLYKEDPPLISKEEFLFLRAYIEELSLKIDEASDKCKKEAGQGSLTKVEKPPIFPLNFLDDNTPSIENLNQPPVSVVASKKLPKVLFEINEKPSLSDLEKLAIAVQEAYDEGNYSLVTQSVNTIFRRLPRPSEISRTVGDLPKVEILKIIDLIKKLNQLLFKATICTSLNEATLFSALKGSLITAHLFSLVTSTSLSTQLSSYSRGILERGILDRRLCQFYRLRDSRNTHLQFADLKMQLEFHALDEEHERSGLSGLIQYQDFEGKSCGAKGLYIGKDTGSTWETDYAIKLLSYNDFMDEAESKLSGFKAMSKADQLRQLFSSDSPVVPQEFLALREQACMLDYLLVGKIEKPKGPVKPQDFLIKFEIDPAWHLFPIFTITALSTPADIKWSRTTKDTQEARSAHEHLHRPFTNPSFTKLLNLIPVPEPSQYTLENFLVAQDFKAMQIDLPRDECIAILSCFAYNRFQPLLALNFFEKNLEKLNDQDYQTLFQILILDRDVLSSTLFSSKFFSEKLEQFVKKGFEKAKEKSDLKMALFFHRLNDIFSTGPKFKDQKLDLNDIINFLKTEEEKNLFYLQKSASYAFKENLTTDECADLLFCKIYLNTHPFKKEGADPKVVTDSDGALFKWVKKIDENADQILKNVVLRLGYPLGQGDFKQLAFPIWQSLDGKYRVNMALGTLEIEGKELGVIPYGMLNHEDYKYFFGNQSFPCEFLDPSTCQFRNSTGNKFILRLDGNDLIIQREFEGHLFQFIPKNYMRKIPGDFPLTFVENYDHWKSMDNPLILWSVDHERGVPEYEIISDGKEFVQISPYHEKELHLCAPENIKFLYRFEHNRFILCWEELDALKRIDLPRFNLHFDVDESQGEWKLKCREFPGYHLAKSQIIEGYEIFYEDLVLINDRGEKKVLIPKRELTMNIEGSLYARCVFDQNISSSPKTEHYCVYDVDEKHHRLYSRKYDDTLRLALIHLAIQDYKGAFACLKEKGSKFSDEENNLLEGFINSAKMTRDHFPDAVAVRLHAQCLLLHNIALYGGTSIQNSGLGKEYHDYLNLRGNISDDLLLTDKEESLLLDNVEMDSVFVRRKQEIRGEAVLPTHARSLRDSRSEFWNRALKMNYKIAQTQEKSALFTRWGRELITNLEEYYAKAQSQVNDSERQKFLARLEFAKYDPDEKVRVIANVLEIVTKSTSSSFPPFDSNLEEFIPIIIYAAMKDENYQPQLSVEDRSASLHKTKEKPLLGPLPLVQHSLPPITVLQDLVTQFFTKQPLPEDVEDIGFLDEDFQAYRDLQKGKVEYQLQDPEGLRIHLQELQKQLDESSFQIQEELLSLANKDPSTLEERAEKELAHRGKKATSITLSDIILCFTRRDFAKLKELNPSLNEADVATIKELLKEFFVEKTLSNQASRALILTSPQDIANALLINREYSVEEHPEFIVFEYFSDITLRDDQVKKLQMLLKGDNDGLVLQMIMGSGKSKVLLPILSISKADGKRLSTIVVPDSLYSQTVEDLSHNPFSQGMMTLEFGRHFPDTTHEYSRILKILKETIEEKKALITTSKSIQSIYLKALESLKIDPHSEKSQLLKEILKIFKEQGHVIIDEADDALSCRKENNYSFGKGHALEFDRLELSTFLYDAILEEEGSFEFLKDSKGPVINDEYYHSIIKPHLVKKLQEKWKDLDQAQLFDYLMGKEQKPSFVESIKDQKLRDLLALAKEQLNVFLPLTLKKNCDENYGLDPSGVIAIPFVASNTPLLGTQFGVPYESANYTIQAYLKKGISKDLVKSAIKELQEQAMDELRGREIRLEETESYKKFVQLSPEKTKLNLFQINEEDISKIVQNVNESKKSTLRFISEFILDKIQVHDQKLSSNPHDLCGLFANVQGFTGTLWNEKSFPTRMKPLKEAGTDARTLVQLWRNSKGEVYETTKKEAKEILKELKDASAFIDTGGVLRGLDNQTIAREMLKEASALIQGVVFFDERNRIVIIERGKDRPIPLEESRVPLEARLTLYDQKHTTGADIKQKKGAKGVVTIGPQTFLRDILQSVWRLRQLESGQRAQFLITPNVKDLILKACKKEGHEKVELEDIIEFCIQNQAKRESEDNFIATRQKMHHLVAKKALEDLMDGKIAFKDVEHLFFHSTRDEPYETYGKRQQEVAVDDAIQREIARLDNRPYTADFNSVVDRKSLPELVMLREGLDTNVEVEVEVEAEKDQEIENVAPRSIEPRNAFWATHLLGDDWFTIPIITIDEVFFKIPALKKFQGLFSPYLKTTLNFHTSSGLSEKPINFYGVLRHHEREAYEVVLMDSEDAALLFEATLASNKLEKYNVTLVQPTTGIIHSSSGLLEQREVENPDVKMLLVQAKFLQGEINYNKEEIKLLRKWMGEKDKGLLKELFENHIIKSKLGTRKQFGTSSLGKLFSELGV